MAGRVWVGILESAHQVTTPGTAAGRLKRSVRTSWRWFRERLKELESFGHLTTG